MAKREIVIEGDELLRKISKPVSKFDEKLAELLDDMKETMRENDGCGIAGVQVGVLRRVFVIEAEGVYLEAINPEITCASGEEEGLEGCLSVPNRRGTVIRPTKLTLKAFTRDGTQYEFVANDFLARVISHEYDHLNGILYIDKLVDKK